MRNKGYKGSQRLIVRWRYEYKKEGNRYWGTREGKRCKICEEEEGFIEHILTHVRRESKIRDM